MSAYELLTTAQNLILDPHKWTKNAYARDEDWEEVEPESEQAVCFCTLGALRRAAGPDGPLIEAKHTLETALMDIDPDASIPGFNDRSSHAEVMTLFDKARELANG